MGSTVDSEACIEVLAPVAGVRAALAGARALRATTMTPTVDAIAGIEVLALITGVRVTLTNALTRAT